MPIEVKMAPVNLMKYWVRGRQTELHAVTEIQSQILSWLREEGISPAKLNTILVNKLVYFSAMDLEKENPKLKISRGWFRYGPCYELGRHSEGSLSLAIFRGLKPSKEASESVSRNCETEIPIFLKHSDSPKEFPYEYIEHVYRDRCDEPTLGPFYLCKHHLSGILHDFSRNGSIDEGAMNSAMFEFERILLGEYSGAVGISRPEIGHIMEFTALLGECLGKATRSQESAFPEALRTEVVNHFLNQLMPSISSLNYKRTFTSASTALERIIKNKMGNIFRQYIQNLPQQVSTYYSLMRPA